VHEFCGDVRVSGRKYEGVILDIDGVLKRGSKPILGAPETVNKLRELGLKVIFLSNLSTKSREEYVQTLRSIGINVWPEDLVLATSATADYVARHSKTRKVYVVGHEGLMKELRRAGLILVNDPEEAEFVVAGSPFDEKGFVTEENRWKFTGAIRAIMLANAKFVAVNPDKLFPGSDGKPIPGTGTFLGAIEAATGVKPLIIGKPSRLIYKVALDRLGTPPEKTIMVGDQIYTDILPAKELGLTTVLVLTGITRRDDLEKMDDVTKSKIDYVFNSVRALVKLVGGEKQC